MAPLKFEENIREKLQERELQPGKETWEKLAAQLDLQKPPKKRTPFLWMAASFIGAVIIASLIFQSEKAASPLVKQEPLDILKEKNLNEQPIHIVEGVQEGELPVHEVSNETELASSIPKSRTRQKGERTTQNSNPTTTGNQKLTGPEENAVAVISSIEKLPGKEVEESKDDILINTKIEEVVAEVQTLQQRNNAVTPDEIEALLAKAQRDISNRRILQLNSPNIDASALLSDVELELENSFREKVFQALGEGFIKIRTAVSERNN